MAGQMTTSAVDAVFASLQAHKCITPDVLLALHFCYPSSIRPALELLELDRVARIVAHPSGRTAYQVVGHSGDTHTCLGGACTCKAFERSVLQQRSSLHCKHQIAVRLACALDGGLLDPPRHLDQPPVNVNERHEAELYRIREEQVPDAVFASMILAEEAIASSPKAF